MAERTAVHWCYSVLLRVVHTFRSARNTDRRGAGDEGKRSPSSSLSVCVCLGSVLFRPGLSTQALVCSESLRTAGGPRKGERNRLSQGGANIVTEERKPSGVYMPTGPSAANAGGHGEDTKLEQAGKARQGRRPGLRGNVLESGSSAAGARPSARGETFVTGSGRTYVNFCLLHADFKEAGASAGGSLRPTHAVRDRRGVKRLGESLPPEIGCCEAVGLPWFREGYRWAASAGVRPEFERRRTQRTRHVNKLAFAERAAARERDAVDTAILSATTSASLVPPSSFCVWIVEDLFVCPILPSRSTRPPVSCFRDLRLDLGCCTARRLIEETCKTRLHGLLEKNLTSVCASRLSAIFLPRQDRENAKWRV